MSKINIAQKFSTINDFYHPRIATELNGQYVKLVKFDSPFVFHHHDHEDEMFLVVKGRFRMEFREPARPETSARQENASARRENDNASDRHEWIEEGEFIVVPRGVEHRPVAEEECWVMLFEPASTLNTGNLTNERTVRQLEHV